MRVTAVEPKRKSLSALYIDGEYAMSLDTQTLADNRIEAGVELDDERLFEIKKESDYRRAKEKALWLLSGRDYSEKELEKKLSATCDNEASILAVERMVELGLVNDERFANRYACDLINIKHLSQSAVVYKLVQKGIDRELAREVAQNLEVEPTEQIRAVIEKKYLNRLNDEKSIRRAVAALQRMGYRWSDIKSVIYDYTDDEEEY